MRHFLRVDGGCSVGPSLGAVVYVENGETLHLDENIEDEALVAGDISRSTSGWIEVDESGAAVVTDVDRSQPDERRHRFATATPVVTEPDIATVGENDQYDGEFVEPTTDNQDDPVV
jgi:hypothetical protein